MATTRFGSRDSSGNPFQWSFSLQHMPSESIHNNETNQNNRYSGPANRGSRFVPNANLDYDIGMDAFHENIMAYQQNMRTYQHNMYDYITLVDSELRHRNRRNERMSRRSAPLTTEWPRFTATTNDLFTRFADQFQNVVVAPTDNQIANATRNIVFNENTEYLNTNCPITLENFATGDEVTQIINCGHIFHGPAIQNWFRTNVHCPVCRYDIRNYEAETEDRDNDEILYSHERDANNNVYQNADDLGDSEPINSNPPPADELMTNITDSLNNLLQNYLDNESTNTNTNTNMNGRTTMNTNQIFNEINRFVNQFDSTATSVEFEFPLLIYRDLSGNRRTFM